MRKVVLFLLFAFGISWASAWVLYLCGVEYGSGLSLAVVATFFMMAPAAAAVIVQKGLYKQPIDTMGLELKKTRWKLFLWLPLIQFLFCIFYVIVIFVCGNFLKIEGFGFYSFDQGLLDQRMQEMVEAAGMGSLPQVSISPVVLFAITVVTSIIVGAIVNGVFAFGEELGWRGFLYNETKQLGFWKSNLLTGTIWGLWHAPIILQGHNYPEHPFIGALMMVPLCISMSFILSWLRVKTNSVLAPAFFHGMINASGGGLIMLCYEYNDLVGSIAGLAGVIGNLLILLMIFLFDRKTIRSFSGQE